jgi:ABC-2 type transport system permease protein
MAAELRTERLTGLGRLLRLWRLYAGMDLLWLTRDAKTALTGIISDVVLSLGRVGATWLLAERFAGIGDWSRHQVLFMLGYGITVNGLLVMFCNYNISHISRRLGRGQLDHLLIQPQPLWMALLTEGFAPTTGSAVLLTGVGLLAWAVRGLGLALTPRWLAMTAANLLASATVAVAFSFLWGSLAFWAPRAAEEISSSAVDLVVGLKMFPLDGLASGLLGGLLTFLPVGFVAWYPSRCLVGLDLRPWAPGVTPLAALVLSALAAWVFTRGMRHYGRTGSQRYSDFGHRR